MRVRPRFSVRTLLLLLMLAGLAGAAWRTIEFLRNVEPRALARIERLGGVCDRGAFPPKTIEFYGGAFTDREFELLAHFPRTRALYIVNCHASDVALEQVGKISSLEHLHIQGARFRGDGLRHLTKLPRLAKLRLQSAPIDDRAINHLAAISSLQTLIIRDCQITSAGAESLSRLSHLTVLEVNETTHFPASEQAAQ